MALLTTIANALVSRATVEPKAASGPGVAMVEQGGMGLIGDRTGSARWLRKMQGISHVGWPAVAERIVSGRAAAVPWHLEDPDGDTIDEKYAAGPYHQAFELLSHPMGTDFAKPSDSGARLTQTRLWRLTLRHMGVVNLGAWFLSQPDLLAGIPLETMYLNPSRLTPATDKHDNLIGWVLDADETYSLDHGNIRGIPLSLNEVIPFWLEPPDDGYYGVGLVEQALQKIRLAEVADRNLTQLFGTGGRRGSFIGPAEGRMSDDVYDALVAGLRNIADSPDSAKRNIVSKGKLDVQPQASTPDELQIYEIVGMTRDDILGMWGVPLSQTGIPAAAGLNSGEVRKYDEAALWQNAIHPRLDAFRETIQLYLLERWSALGIEPPKLILDEPSFDDEAPRYEIAEKARVIPLMDNERRNLTGHDPLPEYDEVTGEPLGVAIRLPKDLVLVGIGPGEEKRPTPAVATVPDAPEEVTPDEEVPAPEPPPVASKAASLPARAEVEATETPDLRTRLNRFLAFQQREITARVRERAAHLLVRRGDADAVWQAPRWDTALRRAIEPVTARIATTAATAVRSSVGSAAKADEFIDDAVEFVHTRGGERITGINLTTREAVMQAIREAIEEAVSLGMSPDEAADLLSDRIGDLSVWTDARSELVARTETMFAYNDAALSSYRALDVGQVIALDGDKDDACAARDGQTFSIDDALLISDHPNGTLDWAPA